MRRELVLAQTSDSTVVEQTWLTNSGAHHVDPRGQAEIRRGYSENWDSAGIQVREIKNAAIHEIGAEVIISEWVGDAMILSDHQDLAIKGLLIITVQDGMIIHTSDYMDALGLAMRTGRHSDLALRADQPSTFQTE